MLLTLANYLRYIILTLVFNNNNLTLILKSLIKLIKV